MMRRMAAEDQGRSGTESNEMLEGSLGWERAGKAYGGGVYHIKLGAFGICAANVSLEDFLIRKISPPFRLDRHFTSRQK